MCQVICNGMKTIRGVQLRRWQGAPNRRRVRIGQRVGQSRVLRRRCDHEAQLQIKLFFRRPAREPDPRKPLRKHERFCGVEQHPPQALTAVGTGDDNRGDAGCGSGCRRRGEMRSHGWGVDKAVADHRQKRRRICCAGKRRQNWGMWRRWDWMRRQRNRSLVYGFTGRYCQRRRRRIGWIQ